MSVPSPFRILVDLTHLYPKGEGGGIKPALEEMFRWLGRQDGTPLEFVFLVNPIRSLEGSGLLRPVDRVIPIDRAPADVAARENCHLVYCPFGMTDWACPGIPTITLIVDLLHRDFPQSLSVEEQRTRGEYTRTAMERTDLFQVISNYTAGQLQSHYQVEAPRIIRTYLPIHDRLLALESTRPIEAGLPYFFYPANAWAHKNHEPLLMAYALYRQAAGPDAWRLVLTGFMGAAMLRLQSVAALLGLSDHVEFLGYVDEARLAALWKGAGVLVFPSLHEGFGIPLLEAMAHQVPILASDSTAIPEITAGAALLVKGRAPLDLAQAMQELATSPELRRALVGRGQQRLADFSPDIEFARLLQGFRQTAAKPARWRQSGYYPEDGLTGPEAIIALPHSPAAQKVAYATRPLGVPRTLEFWSGSQRLGQTAVAAGISTTGDVAVPTGARVLTLRVPDATRLSPTDPRTHGVLLERLQIHAANGTVTDLLTHCAP